MASRWINDAIRCWGVTIVFILIFLFTWYLWGNPSEPTSNVTRTKRNTKPDNKTHTWVNWLKTKKGVGRDNNWFLIVEQAANATSSDCVVCMGPRPIARVVPAAIPAQCLNTAMSDKEVDVTEMLNCTKLMYQKDETANWTRDFPKIGTQSGKPSGTPWYDPHIAKGNFSCINLIGSGKRQGNLTEDWCQGIQEFPTTNFSSISRADIWWWCGKGKVLKTLPINCTGLCALVSFIMPVTVFKVSSAELVEKGNQQLPVQLRRTKRTTWQQTDPTYIDAIGVPRGVPDEYKIADQVAAGFESLFCWWCTINKNVDRINYIHYNVQKLGNWTQSGFEAVHGQLSSTSLMAFQNRIALDMLLAEKGGVCAIFGEQCCTFIPNNTAADGSLTKAIEGLKTLNGKMKDHSGVDTTMWDSWLNAFGKYRTLVSSILISLAVFAAILTLCGCCCIPCLRS
ncbi:uncharacterized protein LOC122879110 isoform X2 [Siniperca chuatsi]|nr:uncharacterized protein LOC122879110 isoform X2 [Siniperca chuatsi]